MNSTSYMFSFVLGLIVVIVFLVVLNSRFNFVGNLFNRDTNRVAVNQPTPSPAPSVTLVPTTGQNQPTARPTQRPTAAPQILGRTSPAARPTAQPTQAVQNNQRAAQPSQTRTVTQIPNTGSPTAVIAVLPALLALGVKLRKLS